MDGNKPPLSLCTAAIESQNSGYIYLALGSHNKNASISRRPERLCGPMDKARVYGTRDSRFDPWQSQCEHLVSTFCNYYSQTDYLLSLWQSQ